MKFQSLAALAVLSTRANANWEKITNLFVQLEEAAYNKTVEEDPSQANDRGFSPFIMQKLLDIQYYGCWCYLDDTWDVAKGPVQDGLDQECKNLVQNYRCLVLDALDRGDTCDPANQDYTEYSLFGGSGNLTNDCETNGNELGDATTTQCRQDLCKADGEFTLNLFALMFTALGGIANNPPYDPAVAHANNKGVSSLGLFDPATDCRLPVNISEKVIEHSPLIMFNLRKIVLEQIRKSKQKKIAVVDFWQFTNSIKNLDRFAGKALETVDLYVNLLENLMTMQICPECVDAVDTVLEYVDYEEDTSSPKNTSPITCTDSTCTIGHWTNCIDTNFIPLKTTDKTSKASETYDALRGMISRPSIELHLSTSNKTFCGESNQLSKEFRKTHQYSYTAATFCDVSSEKSCCSHDMTIENGYSENDRCVLKENCDKSNWFDIDLNDFRQAEACLWKPDEGRFRVLTMMEAREKLRGKKLFIIGDSHSRNMFISMVTLLTSEYHEKPHIASAIHTPLGPGSRCTSYHWHYHNGCRDRFVIDYHDIEGNFSVHWKVLWSGGQGDRINGITENDHWLWTQGMHQNYDYRFALQMSKRLREISRHGTFVTPPVPSFGHPPEHRRHQRPSKLKEMAELVDTGIRKEIPDVRFIRFDQLSEFVDSVDGVHYGYNINRVLMSIYLNDLK